MNSAKKIVKLIARTEEARNISGYHDEYHARHTTISDENLSLAEGLTVEVEGQPHRNGIIFKAYIKSGEPYFSIIFHGGKTGYEEVHYKKIISIVKNGNKENPRINIRRPGNSNCDAIVIGHYNKDEFLYLLAIVISPRIQGGGCQEISAKQILSTA